MVKEAEIKDQPENQSFDYRVRALNHAGIGAPSNTVKF
ncbi:MAG: fibronectin type III domain-containing protein [Deltaproteobacteria bacterium]|nr:fibronectin type III domain-containing protein [Deltaproteobacteria bacterium]